MLKIKKDGYIISQANNGHIMICKDNQMVFHISTSYKCKDKEELLKALDLYFNLVEKVGE